MALASSYDSADAGGKLTIHANGRQASMITLEWEVTPRALSSAGSGDLGDAADLEARIGVVKITVGVGVRPRHKEAQ
jgi:hypothetical protein